MLRCFGVSVVRWSVVRDERGWERARSGNVSAFFVQMLGLRLHWVMRQIVGTDL